MPQYKPQNIEQEMSNEKVKTRCYRHRPHQTMMDRFIRQHGMHVVVCSADES